ncbi:MAG: hypothetical protein MHM6MM_002576 [Cercozoa sp. M6MM]
MAQRALRLVRGDLIELAEQGAFDVIVHGCNCQCSMGKGIALAIKKRFPAAFRADCATPKGDAGKLGTISSAYIENIPLHVVNAYTQDHWRRPRGFSGSLTDYEAVRHCIRQVRQQFPGTHVGLPKIGAGLGGGDWTRIRGILEDELAKYQPVTVVFLPGDADCPPEAPVVSSPDDLRMYDESTGDVASASASSAITESVH